MALKYVCYVPEELTEVVLEAPNKAAAEEIVEKLHGSLAVCEAKNKPKLEYETITDDSGWEFKMPKLTQEMVVELRLGTWDLADYTFGTCHGIIWMYKPASEIRGLERLLWRIENWLRRKEWEYFLLIEWYGVRNRRTRFLHKLFKTLRHAAFKLAWRWC